VIDENVDHVDDDVTEDVNKLCEEISDVNMHDGDDNVMAETMNDVDESATDIYVYDVYEKVIDDRVCDEFELIFEIVELCVEQHVDDSSTTICEELSEGVKCNNTLFHQTHLVIPVDDFMCDRDVSSRNALKQRSHQCQEVKSVEDNTPSTALFSAMSLGVIRPVVSKSGVQYVFCVVDYHSNWFHTSWHEFVP